MTKEEYRKASHFRDAPKMVAAPGSLSGLFDYAPLFRVCFRLGAENTYTADTAPDRQAVFLYLLNDLKFEAVR